MKMKIIITLQLFCIIVHQISAQGSYSGLKCRKEHQTFEILPGLIHVSPADTISTIPDSLHLTDCLSKCRRNSACLSVNYETGLCILFNSSSLTKPNTLSPANFPVFTIYAQKLCYSINVNAACRHREWAFERVNDYQLTNPSFVLRRIENLSSRVECMERCLLESDFTCRSMNFRNKTGTCELMEMNRHAISSKFLFEKYFIKNENNSVEYIESNCIQEANAMCFFKKMRNKMIKTVDSLYEHIKSEDQCKALCLNNAIKCHSYTLGDKNSRACRISHLSTNSLSHIVDPWMITHGADTYELTSCYNVTVSCDSHDMTATVLTNRIFDGKIYGKNKPKSCVNDIKNSLSFNLTMPYNDLNCEVLQTNFSRYSKDIVIQHHDLIVTTKDIGLSIHCSYDLTNRTVMNSIRIEDVIESKEGGNQMIHSSFVYSPNVTIQIKDIYGQDVKVARVGDSLTLRFVIDDENTPYEIFIRELIASDGTDSNEIVLIDSNGCPTDVSILGSINKRIIKRNEDKNKNHLREDERKEKQTVLIDEDKSKSANSTNDKQKFKAKSDKADDSFTLNTKQLEASFEAFKFPTTDIVQFKAVITPCLGECKPALCKMDNPDGTTFTLGSYGRRRKRSLNNITWKKNKNLMNSNPDYLLGDTEESMIVVQSIKITDNFAFQNNKNNTTNKLFSKNSRIDEQESLFLDKELTSNSFLTSLSNAAIIVIIFMLVLCQIVVVILWIYLKNTFKLTKNKIWWKDAFDNQLDNVFNQQNNYPVHFSKIYPNKITSLNNDSI